MLMMKSWKGKDTNNEDILSLQTRNLSKRLLQSLSNFLLVLITNINISLNRLQSHPITPLSEKEASRENIHLRKILFTLISTHFPHNKLELESSTKCRYPAFNASNTPTDTSPGADCHVPYPNVLGIVKSALLLINCP